MFDVDRFVLDCRDAAAASGLPAVLDVVASAVSTPDEVLKGLASRGARAPTFSIDRLN